jgi:hypothetical protein
MGKIANEFHKDQGLFRFGLRKFKIEFLKGDDLFGVFSPKELMGQNVIHGI